MSIPTDPIEGYYAQQTPTPTARELLDRLAATDVVHPERQQLAARVEAALAILDRFRPPPISGCYDTALVVGEIRRALDGRQE